MSVPAGMSAATGAALDDLAHIRQSVRDILTTPLGSRAMRRDYGSLVPRLIDQPAHAATRMRIISSVYTAISRWEDRIRVTAIRFDIGYDGKAAIALDAVRVDNPQAAAAVSLVIPL